MFLSPRFLLAGVPSPLLDCLELELELIGQVCVMDISSQVFSDIGIASSYVSLARPDILIHVVLKEENQINPGVPSALLHGLIGTDAIFIHVSDINLFSGLKNSLYTENDYADSPDPKSQKESLSQAKLNSKFVRSLIIRTGSILGSTTNCLLKHFLKASVGRRHVTVDQGNLISVISVGQLTKMLVLLIKKAVLQKEINGIYNLSCLGQSLESDILLLALNTACQIRPELSWPRTAIRSNKVQIKNLEIDCTKFQLATGTVLPDWQDAVIEVSVNIASQINK